MTRTEQQIKVFSLEKFARMSYPDSYELQAKSTFLGLLKMNPDWAREFLSDERRQVLQDEAREHESLATAAGKWQLDLQERWRQERDPDGVVDKLVADHIERNLTKERR
jgi:hypothetical protein